MIKIFFALLFLIVNISYAAVYDDNGDLYTDSIRNDAVDDDRMDQPLITIRTQQYQGSLAVLESNGLTPLYSREVWYDHTGGNFEKLLNLVSGSEFTSTDEEKFIVLSQNGTYSEACEIVKVINGSEAIVSGFNWDQDFGTALSPRDSLTYLHPYFVVGDGGKLEAYISGSETYIEFESEAIYYDYLFEIEAKAAKSAIDVMIIEAEAEGYNNITALKTKYESGDLGTEFVGIGIQSDIDISEATSSGTDAEVFAFLATVEGHETGQPETEGFVTGPSFDTAFRVIGAEEDTVDYGYEVASSAVTNRTAEFASSASNVELFDDNGDYILVGDSGTFEIIDVELAVGSFKNINPTFEYSTGAGTWSTLTVLIDSTNGFQNSGQILFNAPVGWVQGNQAEAPADINNAYYIRITRTYNPNIPTLPTESTITIFPDLDTGYKVDGMGFVYLRESLNADAPNETMYFSTDSNKPGYKDSGGTFHAFY